METQLPLPKQPHKGGVPMWIALVVLGILLLLLVAGIGGTYFYVSSDQRKLRDALNRAEAETARAKLATDQVAQKTGLTLAKTHQEAMLTQARAATNLLMRLLAEERQLRSDAASLQTNEAGRAVALFPALVRQAQHFYETDLRDLASREDIVTRLEGVRRVELQLVEAAGTAYEPVPDLGTVVQGGIAWGELATTKATQLRQMFTSLGRESKVRVTDATLTPASPTLAGAITQLAQTDAGTSMEHTEQTTSTARTNATAMKAEAEAQKIRADAERYAEEMRRKLAEEQAAKEREWQEREARLKLEETKTKVAVQTKADEARNVELRKKASDPAIQTKLAPFTTPGRVRFRQVFMDIQPYSLRALQGRGALTANMHGLTQLVEIAIEPADKERPRWKLSRKFWVNHPDDIAMVQEVQQLLIELGPVLVEMGKLQP